MVEQAKLYVLTGSPPRQNFADPSPLHTNIQDNLSSTKQQETEAIYIATKNICDYAGWWWENWSTFILG